MVTDAQRKVIGYIEKNLRVKFTGGTKEEAKQFIGENMEASKRATRRPILDRDAALLALMPRKTNGGATGEIEDSYGKYRIDDSGEIWHDEDYDHRSYADMMNSTF